MDKYKALAHPLPTLAALAPTSSPLLQQRFMRQTTAPAPTASRIGSSSQEIRRRNNPVNLGVIPRDKAGNNSDYTVRRPVHRRVGQPLAPRTMATELSAVRTLFWDCQEWDGSPGASTPAEASRCRVRSRHSSAVNPASSPTLCGRDCCGPGCTWRLRTSPTRATPPIPRKRE